MAIFGIPLLAGLMMVSAIPSVFAVTPGQAIVTTQASGSYTVATGPYTVSIGGADYECCPFPYIIPGMNYAYISPPAVGCYAGGTPNPHITSTNPPWAIYAVDSQILSSAGLFLFQNFYWSGVTVTYYVVWYC